MARERASGERVRGWYGSSPEKEVARDHVLEGSCSGKLMEVADVGVEEERAREEVRGEDEVEAVLETGCRLGCDGSSKEMTGFVGEIGLSEDIGIVWLGGVGYSGWKMCLIL
jgi:hypothetical protein